MKQVLQPPWLSWQGESSVQSFDLDSMGLIPAIPQTQITGLKPEIDVFYHQGSGTASLATPRGCHCVRAEVGFELAI